MSNLLALRSRWSVARLPDGPLELDRSVPHAADLKVANYFHDKRRGFNLALNQPGSFPESESDLVPTKYGWTEDFAGFNSNEYIDTEYFNDTDDFTCLTIIRAHSAAGGSDYSCIAQQDDHWRMQWNFVGNSSYRESAFFRDSGGTYRIAKFGVGLNADQWYALGFRIEGGYIYSYRDGAQINSAGAGLDPEAATNNIVLANSPNLTNEWNGEMPIFLFWDKAIPESLLIEASHNPFLYLKARSTWVPGFVPTAQVTGNGAFSAGNASMSSEGDVQSTIGGQGALSAGNATMSGEGTAQGTATGEAALQAGNATVAGTGTVETVSGVSGEGALQAGSATIAAEGDVQSTITVQAALAANDASLSAEGDVETPGMVEGEAALNAQAATVSSEGTVQSAITGQSALSAQSATMSGTIVAQVPDGWARVSANADGWTRLSVSNGGWVEI